MYIKRLVFGSPVTLTKQPGTLEKGTGLSFDIDIRKIREMIKHSGKIKNKSVYIFGKKH